VRLYSRPGNDFTRRFPVIVEALTRLRSRSCVIDGEAVACDDNGVASFDLIRHHRLTRALASPFFQVSKPGEGRVVPLPPRGLPTEVEAAIRWNPPAVKALLEAVAHADPPAVKALLEAVAHAAGALG
jgi:hypothetical protein